MAKIKCFDEVKKALPDAKDQEVKAILEELNRRKGKAFSSDAEIGSVAFQRQADEFLKERRIQRAQAHKEAAENLIKTQRRLEFYSQEAFMNDPVAAMRALVEGTGRYSRGGNKSVGRMATALQGKFLNNLAIGLKEAGVWEIVQKGLLQREIMMELFEMKPGGKTGISQSKEALSAAKVFKNVQLQMLDTLRKAGANVGEIPGYIMRQAHEPSSIKAAGFEKWAQDIVERLDLEKSFDGAQADEVGEALKEVYNDIVTGRFEKATAEGVSDSFITVNGASPNLNRKLSKSRKLHFKSGSDFYEYNLKYGKRDILSSVALSAQQTARNAAMMVQFGTNPRAAFEADKVRLRKKFRDNEKALLALEQNQKKLEQIFETAQGVSSIPGSSIVARTGRNTRAIVSMSSLGGAVLSSITDLASAMATLRAANGKNIFENASSLAMRYFEGIPDKADRQKWAQRLGIYLEDILGESHARFGSEDSGPGAISRMQRLFFKLNGLDFHTQVAKVATAKQFAMELADHHGVPFGKLPNRVRLNLERFGIDADRWEILQGAVQDLDGYKVMTPEAVKDIPDEVFRDIVLKDEDMDLGDEKAIKEAAGQLRFDTELSLLSYLSDAADTGVPTPGVKEKAFLLRGTKEDDGMGQLLRFVAQFKSFPMTVMNLGERVLLSNPETRPVNMREAILQGKGDMMGMAQFMVSATVLGYLAGVAKDAAQGKTPKDPTDPKVIAESFVKGGSAGLYGDFLLGEFDRRYRSALDTLAGPTFGKANDFFELFSRMKKGEAESGEAFRLMINNLPGQNLFYTRTALDYLVLYQAQESLSPGFLRRLEQRTRRTPGLLDETQDYFISSPREVTR